MKTVIDCRNNSVPDKALRIFTINFWVELAGSVPDHAFIILVDLERSAADDPINLFFVVLSGGLPLPWRNRLGPALRTWKADRYITVAATGFTCFTLSGSRTDLSRPARPPVFLSFIDQLPPGHDPAKPYAVIAVSVPLVVNGLSWMETESIKTQFSAGRSYFLFVGNIGEEHDLIELLKGFSAFKKRQQSNMQLVIAGYSTAWSADLDEKLEKYKYRSEVSILKNVPSEDIARLFAACYAVVYPAAEGIFPLALCWGVQSGKAIIASDTVTNRNILTAAEWVDKTDTAEGFGKAMILLFSDENQLHLREEAAAAAAAKLDRKSMIATTWLEIQQ